MHEAPTSIRTVNAWSVGTLGRATALSCLNLPRMGVRCSRQQSLCPRSAPIPVLFANGSGQQKVRANPELGGTFWIANSQVEQAMTSNSAVNASHSAVTALAQSGKRRAVGRILGDPIAFGKTTEEVKSPPSSP